MTRHLRLLAALLSITGSETWAQSPSLDPFTFLTMRVGDETPVAARARPYDVEIDQTIKVEWDEPRFLATVASGVRGAEGTPLKGRLELLSPVLSNFLDGQAAMLELRVVASRRAAARLRGDFSAFQAEFDTASDRSRKALTSSLTAIQTIAQNPAYAGAEAEAMKLRDAADSAVLKDDYTPVAEVIREALADIAQELLERSASGDSILVYMTAWLHSGDTRRQLHLTGYDDFVGEDPMPFPRVRFSVDERTRRELESAEAFATRLENLEQLRTQLRAAGEAFRDAVRSLADKAKLPETNSTLERFLAELRDRSLGPELRQAVEQARRDIEAVIRFTPPTEVSGSDAAALIAFATSFDAAIGSLRSATRLAADRLKSLERELQTQSQALGGTQVDEVLKQIKSAAEALTNNQDVRALFNDLEKTGRDLGLIQRVVAGVGQLGSIGRRIGPHASLDTRLDLLGAGERHPGDYLVIGIQVTRLGPGKPQVLAEARQTFRVRALGFYLEPRGALLFVDPRGPGLGDQDFEPVVGLSYIGHVGLRGAGFWNDVLNPGLGVTLALLDFEDGRDLEVGIGGTLTLLRDFLFIGYGRNIQVKADYFAIGLNPLAFGDLVRTSQVGVSAR